MLKPGTQLEMLIRVTHNRTFMFLHSTLFFEIANAALKHKSSATWLLIFLMISGRNALGVTISGRIKPPAETISIIAFCRDEEIKYEGRIDNQTGEYVIDGLPEGIYDLILRTKRYLIEGIRFETSDKLTPESEKEIETRIGSVELFFNKKKILRIAGNGKYADVLVEQVRDKEYYLNPTGEKVSRKIIRRIEFWRFKKSGQCWVSFKRKHLYREEILSTNLRGEMKHRFEEKFSRIKAVGASTITLPDYIVSAN